MKLAKGDHRLLALWAADCAEHVLPLFETQHPHDGRPRKAIEAGRAWARGDIAMPDARKAAFAAILHSEYQPDVHALCRVCATHSWLFLVPRLGAAGFRENVVGRTSCSWVGQCVYPPVPHGGHG